MKTDRLTRFWAGLTMVVAALSLGPSWAHVLEAPPRLFDWPPELWRETTVFSGQFRLFAAIGAPVDILAILCPALLTWSLRGNRRAFRLALAATVLYALSLAIWFALVNPANAVLAGWRPGPIPTDFDETRLRWETGHMVVAALKFLGIASLAGCLLSVGRRHASNREREAIRR